MYFWSDGYKEYGILSPDPKRIKEDELVDVTDDNVPAYVFAPIVKKTNRQTKRRKLKNFLKSEVQKALRYARFYRHE